MRLSTHYYVLSLSGSASRLYEAFRDGLTDIQNELFPISSSPGIKDDAAPPVTDSELKEFITKADQHFDHYLLQDPLQFIVVGSRSDLSIFDEVTSHRDVLLGRVEGDYIAASPSDLGKITWAIVKRAMAGSRAQSAYNLETAERAKNVVSGINAVAKSIRSTAGDTLFVEEDYSLKGAIRKAGSYFFVSEELDIQDEFDDAVDSVVEKVLENDGRVVFLKNGSLERFKKIVLVKGS
ncbi:MAG: hypothetical protein JW876_04935 [Candidatus Krumholzibacteriota bacterium]|nr:hypothetical protein [Candidatus Krumholzibacteriota bacterium]